MPRHNNQEAQRGFTLLELLIASAISSLLAIISYAAITQVVHTKRAVEVQAQRQQAIQRALWKLSIDLYQMAPRPIRDEYGHLRSALQWDGVTLGLTRLITMPEPEATTGVMRILYQQEGQALVRRRWLYADRLPNTPAQRLVLLKQVRDWAVDFLDNQGVYHQVWPPLNTQGAMYLTALPRAVKIRITLNDGRVLTHWISGVDTQVATK